MNNNEFYTSYQKLVIVRTEKEYEDYKKQILLKSKEEVYDYHEEIFFYSQLKGQLGNINPEYSHEEKHKNLNIEEVYKKLNNVRGNLLDQVVDFFCYYDEKDNLKNVKDMSTMLINFLDYIDDNGYYHSPEEDYGDNEEIIKREEQRKIELHNAKVKEDNIKKTTNFTNIKQVNNLYI